MNTQDFDKVVDRRLNLIKNVLKSKGDEYASENERFLNFIEAGEMQGCAPEQALWGMAAKHFISVKELMRRLEAVQSMVKGVQMYDESFIEEKIGDSINYLILLEGILKESRTKKRIWTTGVTDNGTVEYIYVNRADTLNS